MLPLSMLVPQKLADLLTNSNNLQQRISTLAAACGVTIPPIPSTQVLLTSASAQIGDRDVQLTYPRVCLYTLLTKNAQTEKFRTFSGSVSVIAEVWASSSLINDADHWIHFYSGALTDILRENIGDWEDGVFFGGAYDVQFQAPAVGGFGYVQSAKVICNFYISQN
jgi:hypothetical protein